MLITRVIHKLKRTLWYYVNRKKFAFLSPSVTFQKMIRIEGCHNMKIHDDVLIKNLAWIAAVPLTSSKNAELIVGKGSLIGSLDHIYATQSIVIGDYVQIADKVFIADCTHYYEDITTPISQQPIKQLSPVTIGDGAWLGENVCVLGASVGKGSVVGANSVVLSDVPDYCVAVGAPAKVIKKYNFETKIWEKVY